MTEEEYRIKLERMYRSCPDILSPRKAYSWMPIGRNRIYEMIRTGELPSVVYKGSYIITKESIIDYLVSTAHKGGHGFSVRGWQNDRD